MDLANPAFGAALRSVQELLQHVDTARATAQLHESEMVEIIADFARDVTLEPRFRKECAESVQDRARGRPMSTTRTIIEAPPAQTDAGMDLEAARATVARMREMQVWLNSGRPREEFPEHVRAALDRPAYVEEVPADQ